MTTQIVYSDKYKIHNESSHPENSKRLDIIMNQINKSPIKDEINFVGPELVSEEKIQSVHEEDMIKQIKRVDEEGGGWLDPDTYVCSESFEIARLAAGGLLKLTNNVIKGKAENGFAIVRPPGHHATRNRSMGFCLFNNIAIAANELIKNGKKVLIFDQDVHHGNGTQDIFYNNKNVLYESFHLYPHFPGTGGINEIGNGKGTGYNINAPLTYGNGDKSISILLDDIFMPIAYQFKPDIILISAGYDSHHADVLGGLNLTANFYGEIISRLQQVQAKIVCTLEGGYNLGWLGKCVVSQISTMLYKPIYYKEFEEERINVEAVINSLRSKLEQYWDL